MGSGEMAGWELQSVSKVRPSFALSSQSGSSTIMGRVVHSGQVKPTLVAMHRDEVAHPPLHCILTVNGTLESAGSFKKARWPIEIGLASYSTVSVFAFVSLNAR